MPSVPPAGTSPASAFELVHHPRPLPPPAILADAIDAKTGEYETLMSGRGLADAFVIEAIRIQRGTGAAVRDEGNRYRELTHVDGDGPEVVDSMTRQALEAAEEAGVVRLVQVTVEPDASDPSQLNNLLEYRDLLAPPDEPTRRLVFSR
jgi:hypothetical protein